MAPSTLDFIRPSENLNDPSQKGEITRRRDIRQKRYRYAKIIAAIIFIIFLVIFFVFKDPEGPQDGISCFAAGLNELEQGSEHLEEAYDFFKEGFIAYKDANCKVYFIALELLQSTTLEELQKNINEYKLDTEEFPLWENTSIAYTILMYRKLQFELLSASDDFSKCGDEIPKIYSAYQELCKARDYSAEHTDKGDAKPSLSISRFIHEDELDYLSAQACYYMLQRYVWYSIMEEDPWPLLASEDDSTKKFDITEIYTACENHLENIITSSEAAEMISADTVDGDLDAAWNTIKKELRNDCYGTSNTNNVYIFPHTIETSNDLVPKVLPDINILNRSRTPLPALRETRTEDAYYLMGCLLWDNYPHWYDGGSLPPNSMQMELNGALQNWCAAVQNGSGEAAEQIAEILLYGLEMYGYSYGSANEADKPTEDDKTNKDNEFSTKDLFGCSPKDKRYSIAFDFALYAAKCKGNAHAYTILARICAKADSITGVFGCSKINSENSIPENVLYCIEQAIEYGDTYAWCLYHIDDIKEVMPKEDEEEYQQLREIFFSTNLFYKNQWDAYSKAYPPDDHSDFNPYALAHMGEVKQNSDEKMAVSYWEAAAKQGCDLAAYRLAEYYIRQIETSSDNTAAKENARKYILLAKFLHDIYYEKTDALQKKINPLTEGV